MTWTSSSRATGLLYEARTALTPGALELACHAAVPPVLDVGFLHLLRVNFFIDPPTVLGYAAEAELLNSPLFQESGAGLYEVDPHLRSLLLAALDAAYGFERLTKVALLLEQYTNHADPWQPRELEFAQRLTALSIVEPARAADWLANAQQAAAGRATFGQEWFVAMRKRLTDAPAQAANLTEELTRLQTAEPSLDTARALGRLGLLPGADNATIKTTLLTLARHPDAAVAALATEVIETLQTLSRSDPTSVRENDGTHVDLLSLLSTNARALRDSVHMIRSWRVEHYMLRIPIGVLRDGGMVDLDLKEAAQGGSGPHGLLIGTGGSGRHDLLRAMVAALAITHGPETLNFLLIDGRWNTTFGPLALLPHNAGTITELAGDPRQADRLADALENELIHRQKLFRDAGDVASLRDYRMARQGTGLPLLPTLLVVCDEFTELLSAGSRVEQLFRRIGRTGRALGVHLLLSARRLAEGQLDELRPYLSYRIALRTASAMESRLAVGVPDAYDLPEEPGHGYLDAGYANLVRFTAVRVSGRTPPGRPGETDLDLIVDVLKDAGPPARQVWRPPLQGSIALDEVLGPVTVDPARGLQTVDRSIRGALRVPIAVLDEPREPLWLDLSGVDGHVAVVGANFADKSTVVRSLLTALALTHTPDEVQFYGLGDLGGFRERLLQIPHVGSVTESLADRHRVRRTVFELADLLALRRRYFRLSGFESMGEYWRAGSNVQDDFGDAFLFVEDWAALHEDFAELRPVLDLIADRGPSYGVHLIACAQHWSELPPGTFGSRLELRLDDPGESVISPRAAGDVPDQPGRGISAAPDGTVLDFLTVQPMLSSAASPALLAREIADAWTGSRAPGVRLLPEELPYDHIDLGAADGFQLPIGVGDVNLEPILVDFARNTHLLVTGDPGSGKTSFLRALSASIDRRLGPWNSLIVVLGTEPGEMEILANYLKRRLPSPDVTAQQLRERSWWTGPEVFVLVDDYELMSDQLSPLLPYLSQGRDVGLHLVIAHRYFEVGHALFDPVLLRMTELSPAGVALSGRGREDGMSSSLSVQPLPPGRGIVTFRDQDVQFVQLYHLPPGR